MNKSSYDVVIIGGGISGTALLYELARFSPLKKIALLEKYPNIASVNSHGRNNSQTLHCGDIETNYTLEKAIQVRDTASMVVNFASKLQQQQNLMFRYSKMVLAVGDDECQRLQTRYQQFRGEFPAMQWLERADIAKIEPNVVLQRQEQIAAIGILNEYTAVDFSALAKSLVEQACAVRDRQIDVMLSNKVTRIEKQGDIFQLQTEKGQIQARFVVVSAGGHSLLYAQRMGYGLNYSCLPMAGSFYYTPDVLRGKVYTMQNDKLPFAAIHGDPDILVPEKTRFGPTALMLPVLERYNLKTLPEFLQVLRLDKAVFKVFWDLFKDRDIRNYMFKNILFEVPLVRRRMFLKDVRKIVPALQLKDLTFAKHIGGIRPIMIDKTQACLHLGEAKISTGDGIIFNMTPSPGATSCLGNGEKDLKIICDYLGCDYDAAALSAELKQ